MLEKINTPKDIKGLSNKEIDGLCRELREKILATVEKNGGHLSSNLGMVEATVALHRVFDCPDDALVFDVGHQCYTHKLLTGRYEEFDTLRKLGGISGFTNREESPFDLLTAGHSGSALPVAMGIARANAIENNGRYAVAVIGDGSFTNGMVYETLNSCAGEKLPLIIVLNDNEMSISRNVGSISHYFDKLRNSRKYFALKHRLLTACRRVPVLGKPVEMAAYAVKEFFKNLFLSKNLFESMGLYYMGPVDGHDEAKLEALFREAKQKDCCTLVHIVTVKGKGDSKAEKHPDSYHFAGGDAGEAESFSSVFGKALLEKAEKNGNIVAVTAAMEKGTGLSSFREKYPDRFFDVGIAEECAVTFSGGLAIGGKLPVTALYSTFLQRTFDQILEDLSLQNIHSVLAVDRAGLVAGDGVTHQGVFDVSLLSSVPGITLYSPETFEETRLCLKKCLDGEGLCALRYPKGAEKKYDRSSFVPIGDSMTVSGEGETAVITYGRITANVYEALKGTKGVKIIKLLRLLPLDEKELLRQCDGVKRVAVVEEGIRRGGVGEAVAACLGACGIPVSIRAVEGFLPHGTVEELEKICGFLPGQIKEYVAALSCGEDR
ncbi:MAG: 1-deoxy-D-xylulose-5-phosphate synthase [Clostridia bacterium]|nr:1-deoxy-D-xylulose-5-phosphate synthase [Clostridia bacterium]